ncbi:fimbrial biogenesis chaperone [Vibrio fluvialis]|uniref:fimbrial biogenesis chaperone n=1 Tax=Vibrio fluvialis TaxID=676 RepID=UPI001C9C7DE6|nr:fimbria/pilus periplasmic chaperone [Vibrio fluvialis]EKO3984876.1 hypothetical protein [Vibrio fluvialis]ELI5719255.1 fimbria/pilus periplasmic chaperone [Vibrio fluvialis]MBY7850347.1 fimbria/pilus periplasmic chaperone [Vibrio fluvialis]MBY8287142.1 fimbria/pilus periplasmic chaperone [Vibrio fluvialis]MCE7645044.1 fimbria/pilus periplasmic chaperone [Vibrio fluvialis]
MNKLFFSSLCSAIFFAPYSYSAIAIDRTRAIFLEGEKSISLKVHNYSENAPYLVQAWVDDADSQKDRYFTAIPPIQRVNENSDTKFRVVDINSQSLPNDRESVQYLSIREIPPKSSNENVLQISTQSRIKLFYRPKSISSLMTDNYSPLNDLTVYFNEKKMLLENNSPFHITISSVEDEKQIIYDKALMVKPFENDYIDIEKTINNKNTVFITYIDDWGGKRKQTFSCNWGKCKIVQ